MDKTVDWKLHKRDIAVSILLVGLMVWMNSAHYKGIVMFDKTLLEGWKLKLDFGHSGVVLRDVLAGGASLTLVPLLGALLFDLKFYWRWNVAQYFLKYIVVYICTLLEPATQVIKMEWTIAWTIFYVFILLGNSILDAIMFNLPVVVVAYFIRKNLIIRLGSGKKINAKVIWQSVKWEIGMILLLVILVFSVHYQVRELFLPYFQDTTLSDNIMPTSISDKVILFLCFYWEQFLALGVALISCVFLRLSHYWEGLVLTIIFTAFARVMGTITFHYSIYDISLITWAVGIMHTAWIAPVALMVYWMRRKLQSEPIFKLGGEYVAATIGWLVMAFIGFIIMSQMSVQHNTPRGDDLSALGSDIFSGFIKESYTKGLIWSLDQTGVKHLDAEKIKKLSAESMLGKQIGEIKELFAREGGQYSEDEMGQSMTCEIIRYWKVVEKGNNTTGSPIVERDSPDPTVKLRYHFALSEEGNITAIDVKVIDETASNPRHYKQFYYEKSYKGR